MLTKFVKVNAAQAKVLEAEKELIKHLGVQFSAQDLEIDNLVYFYHVCKKAHQEAVEITENFKYRNPKLMRNIQTLNQYGDVFRKELVRRGQDDLGPLPD